MDNNEKSIIRSDMLGVLKIAAHFHDTGKMFNTFQKKMIMVVETGNASLSDPIRHEFISAVFWDELTKKVEEKNIKNFLMSIEINDLDVAISKTEKIIEEIFKGAYRENRDERYVDEDNEYVEYNFSFTKINDLIGAIGTLILTHHKLPTSTYTHDNFTVVNHFNLSTKTEKDTFLICPGTPFYKEPGWMDSFKSDVENLSDDFIHNGSTELFLRTCLMTADHQAAKEGAMAGSGRYTGGHIANTDRETNLVADDLKTHVKRVVDNTTKSFQSIVTSKDEYPSIQYENIPEAIKYPTMSGRFGWQGNLAKTVETIIEKNDGLFGCVMAGTGTGKTRVAPTIFTHIAKKTETGMRYTLCQPMRVLASQTCKEYCNDLGFSSNDVSHMISKKPLTFEFGNDESTGSENRFNEFDYVDVGSSIAYNPLDDVSQIPEFIQTITNDGSAKSSKMKQMLSTPILSATIDHVMGVASPVSSSHLSGALRLITSDVVLDEVDLYSPEDLAVISRLCYYVGVAGRKLIVMSATITDMIANTLYKFYYEGYKEYCETFNIPVSVKHFTASNHPDSIFHSESFDTCYNKTRDVIISVPDDNTRIATIIELDDIENVCPRVFQSVNKLHNDNHAVINGFKVSAGFIRMTRISHTVSMAKMAHDLEENTLRKYICIHSNMIRCNREYQETYLKKHLTRKGDDTSEGIEKMCNEMGLFDEARTRGVENIQIIVICSPVIETGNDLDFDWAILDPSSTRSIIQSAGRVNRHRNETKSKPNIGILSRPLVTYDSNGNGRFQFPGPETPCANETGINQKFINPSTKYHVNEIYGNIESINSKLIFNDRLSKVQKIENELVKDFISRKPFKSNNSIYRNSYSYVKSRRFRRSDGDDRILWIDLNTNVFYNSIIINKNKRDKVSMKNITTGKMTNPFFKNLTEIAYNAETGLEEYSQSNCEIICSFDFKNTDTKTDFVLQRFVYNEHFGMVHEGNDSLFLG